MTKIFADGADKISILELNKNPLVRGFTTNPALMRKAGIRDYKPFALDILKHIKDKPISFEVFSDDWAEMKAQALEIASWGPNVYVKIPITNTGGWYCETLIEELNWQGVKINITAITTLGQVDFILKKLKGNLTFLSIEPIQEPINTVLIKHINWLIVGAETGNRKDKIIPVNTWLSALHQLKFPVFMKNNLRPIWNYRTPLRQEFPRLKGINI